jgi:hypothetical protein
MTSQKIPSIVQNYRSREQKTPILPENRNIHKRSRLTNSVTTERWCVLLWHALWWKLSQKRRSTWKPIPTMLLSTNRNYLYQILILRWYFLFDFSKIYVAVPTSNRVELNEWLTLSRSMVKTKLFQLSFGNMWSSKSPDRSLFHIPLCTNRCHILLY